MKGKKIFRRIKNKIMYAVIVGIMGAALVSDSLTVTAEENDERNAVSAEFIMPDAVIIDGIKAYDKTFKTGLNVRTTDAAVEKIIMTVCRAGDVNEIVVYENDAALGYVEGRIREIYRLQELLKENELDGNDDVIIDNPDENQNDNPNENQDGNQGGGSDGNQDDDSNGNHDVNHNENSGNDSNDNSGDDSSEMHEDNHDENGTDSDENRHDNNENDNGDLTENQGENHIDNTDENTDINVDLNQGGNNENNPDESQSDNQNETHGCFIHDDDDRITEAQREELENELNSYRNVTEENYKFEDVFTIENEGKYTLSATVYYFDSSYEYCSYMAQNELPECEGNLRDIISGSRKEYSICDAALLDLTSAAVTGEFADKEGGYWFNHSREVNVKILGDNIDYGSLKVIKDGKESKTEINEDNSFSIAFAGDGKHSAKVSIKDLFGRECTYQTGEFAIDSEPPSIDVTITDSGKKYTSKSRKAVALISDANLVGENRIEYEFKEGEDKFEVKATDAAGNESSYESPVFIQDYDKPEVQITGISDSENLNGELNIQVKAKDKYFDKNNSYAQIKGKYTDYSESSFFTDSKEFSFSDSNEMPDDNYEMNYFLCDLAGNNIEGCLSFTLNRTGSTYEISEELENIIGNTVSEVGEISLTERNISRILSDKVELIFAVNSKVHDLVKGKDYFVEEMFENGKYVYRYIFSKSLFEKEGVYTISLSSVDEAGNQNDTRLHKETDGIRFIVEFIKAVFKKQDNEAEAYATENIANEIQAIGVTAKINEKEYDESENLPADKGQMLPKRNKSITKAEETISGEEVKTPEEENIIKEERRKLFNNKVKVALCLVLVLSVLAAGERITRNKKKKAVNISNADSKNLFSE